MASLYTQKESNIFKTWILFTTFLIITIGLGWMASRYFQSQVILWGIVAFSSIMSITSYWFSDKIVLSMAGAEPVEKKDNPELYNIVENLSITAGLPMPKVYIIPELAMNAFATGRDPEHAVVAVTEGLLRRLDRSELEGVLAHELSHIGNRDMLLSTVIVVLVGFISVISDLFLRSTFFNQGNSDDRGNSNTVFFLIGIALSILAPLSATLIQLAISRKREFLADASGALLTRYPEGLVSALEKITSDSVPMQRASTATAHLYFEDPFKADLAEDEDGEPRKTPWIAKMFMTHPPVEERIAALKGLKI